MRTVLITNGNLLTLIGLGEFLLRFPDAVCGVFVTTRLPSQRSNVAGVLSMLRQSGLSYTHFKLLTNVFLPRTLRGKGLPASVAEFLARLGSTAQVVHTPVMNTPEMIERVRALEPEILLSSSATTRFSDALVETARRAAVNAHYALLPGYAGLSPYFWYLRNQEPACGSTLHRIISKLDAGPIIEQRRFPMEGLATVFAVLLRQLAQVSPMLIRYYTGETTEADATPQDLSQRSYFRHPRRADVRALRRHGHRFHAREDLAQAERIVRSLAERADAVRRSG